MHTFIPRMHVSKQLATFHMSFFYVPQSCSSQFQNSLLFGFNVLNAYNISEELCQVHTQILTFLPGFEFPPLLQNPRHNLIIICVRRLIFPGAFKTGLTVNLENTTTRKLTSRRHSVMVASVDYCSTRESMTDNPSFGESQFHV